MADIYAIGVKIALTSNASQVLGALGKDLLGINLKAKDLEGGLNRVKVAALGLSGVVGGTVVLAGMAKLVEHGKDFVHQQSLMAQAGVSQVDIANATAAAWKNATGILNAGASDNLKLLADLRNEFGRMDEAIKASPAFTRLGVVTAAITGGDPEQAGYSGSRFLDLRGSLVDPKTGQISEQRAEQQARLLEAITVATRGRVGTSELLNFQKQARGAGANLTDQGLVSMVPVIQAMGGYRTGTSLTSMMQEIIGGRLTQQAGKFLEDAHVLDPTKVRVRRGGQITVGAGGVVDEQLLVKNPVEYINTVLRKGLERMGAATPEQQTTMLMRDGLRQTVNGLITEVIRNYVPFSRDAGNINQAAKVDQYDVLNKTDPTAKIQSFSTAWSNLMTALGAPIVGDATGLLGKVVVALNGLTKWASEHPTAVANIEVVAGGLAAVAVVGGSLAVAGAALGPFAVALKFLATATIGSTATSLGVTVIGTSLMGLARIVGVATASFAAGYAAMSALETEFPAVKKFMDDHTGFLGSAAKGLGLAGSVPDTLTEKEWLARRAAHPPVTAAPEPLDHPHRSHRHSAPAVADAPAALVSPTAYVTGDGSLQPIHISLTLDGREVARSVTTHQIRGMTPSAQPGTNAWDMRALPTPPGLVTA